MFSSNSDFLLEDFYLWHQKVGDDFVSRKDFFRAHHHYNQALELNPFNLFLIKQIADVVINQKDAACLFPILNNSIRKSLEKRGEDFSVYDMASVVSYISQKAILAHHVAQPTFVSNVESVNTPSAPLRLVVLTCVWQRPALTEVFLSYYQKIAKKLIGKIDLILLAVGSEGNYSRQMCERYNFNYVEYKNFPLSDKWEFGLKHTRNFSPDGVIVVGSDDFISLSLFERYAELLNDGYLFSGLSDGYFLDLANSEELIYWRGYGGLNREGGMPWRLNETLGMGRMYSRLLLEWIDYSLWHEKNINKGLDGVAKDRLFSLGMFAVLKKHAVRFPIQNREFLFGQVSMKMEELDAFALDVKSPSGNVTTMGNYRKSRDACKIIDETWCYLKKYLPMDTVDALRKLSTG